MSIKPFEIKKHDLQPYFRFQAKDSDGVIDITGATIYCTMKSISDGTLKIDRKAAGVNITAGTDGDGEYRWVSGDTDTVDADGYHIEFEVNPASGGKFTIPSKDKEKAVVHVRDSLDTS